jgi:hypothetical protein
MGMPQILDEQYNRSIWPKGDWISGLNSDGIDENQVVDSHGLKIIRVRDYKDKFILRTLQVEARKENPGFKLFDECSQDAFLAWSLRDGAYEPAGYSLITREFYDRRKNLDQFHWYPDTLNQLFVRKEMRRNRIGTGLLAWFVNSKGNFSVWVESPKWETRAILEKLGYKERNESYEVWQMREGLTQWIKGQSR